MMYVDFTHATLCYRGYMLYSISVCLCVTRVLCIKTAKLFVQILLPPDTPSF